MNISNIYIVLILLLLPFLNGLLPLDTIPKIKNNVLRYANYCGPGPDEKVTIFLLMIIIIIIIINKLK